MKRFGNVLWGVVFIVIGCIFGLNALEITNINLFFDGWWTLLIIIPCFIGLFQDKEKTANIIGLLIGIALLLSCQDILDFNVVWKLMFPAIFVVIGVSLIFKETIHSKINDEIKKLNKNQKEVGEYCATFSEQNINFDQEEFHGATVTAVFGGVNCNLKKATILSDVVINASAIFGGIDICVPANVKVKIKSTSIFGGVSNKESLNPEEGVYTVYINATCIFGGVEIK